MQNTPPSGRSNLQEVITLNKNARAIIEGFSTALPILDRFWQQIDASLSDVPALADEITWLRLSRANLAAAGRATLAAYRDAERDPLSYLRDELWAQGLGGWS